MQHQWTDDEAHDIRILSLATPHTWASRWIGMAQGGFETGEERQARFLEKLSVAIRITFWDRMKERGKLDATAEERRREVARKIDDDIRSLLGSAGLGYTNDKIVMDHVESTLLALDQAEL